MLKDKGILKAIWVGMWILCGVLGYLPPQEGANAVLLAVLAVGFFAAPGWLVWVSYGKGDLGQVKLVRNVSLISLAGTLVLIVANMMSVLGTPELGNALYSILAAWSVPMFCGQYWALSLLLWAMLLWGSQLALRKAKETTQRKSLEK